MAGPDLPLSLATNPVLGESVRIRSDGVVEVRSGKVELGQGVLTALAQIAAEELDADITRVQMIAAATDLSPDEGFTAGSLSIQHSGAALRQACAEVRVVYVDVAAAKLAVTPDELDVADGEIRGPDGLVTSYWELADDTLLDRVATGDAEPKRESDYQVVGTAVARLDLPDKLTGRPRYLHDLALDGHLYGRVIRPPSRGAKLRDPDTLDTGPTRALPGVVAVVRDGEFLAVVAEREEVALRAAEQLRRDASWDQRPTLPDENDLPGYLVSAKAETSVLALKEASTHIEVAQSGRSHSARYHRPYLAHASIAPSAATALAHSDGRLEVWSHSQGVHVLRRELAWAPFGPAGVVEIAAECDDDGSVVSWCHEIWSGSYLGRPGTTPTTALLAASHRSGGEPIRAGGEPPLAVGGGAGRNALPCYDFPAYRVINHLLTEMPLRTSALRSLGAFLNVFAAESFMDELAAAAGRDPLEFRLAHLSDPRGRAVLHTAASRAGWAEWTSRDSVGHGMGYARYKNSSAYCAIVAEVEAISEVRVRRLVIAVDAGLVINPDSAVNQIEGGAIQATSWALKERVRFDRLNVISDSWETYPILRFSEVPAIDVEFFAAEGNPALGVGECGQGPTAAAIANAVYDALGIRVRSLPLTPEQLVAAMPG